MSELVEFPDEILKRLDKYQSKNDFTDKELSMRIGISEPSLMKIRENKNSSPTMLRDIEKNGIVGLEEDVFVEEGDKVNFGKIKMIPKNERNHQGYESIRYYFSKTFYITIYTENKRGDLERKLLKYFLNYAIENKSENIVMTYGKVIEDNELGIKDINTLSDSISKLMFGTHYVEGKGSISECIICHISKIGYPAYDRKFELGIYSDHLKRFSNYFYS